MDLAIKEKKSNFPTLFICSEDKYDRAWTGKFVKCLLAKGLVSIYSSTDLLGEDYANEIETLLLRIRKLVIVLSSRCNENEFYRNLVSCVVIKIYRAKHDCDIIPALLDDGVSIPMLLEDRTPAFVYYNEEDKLEEALFNCSENQFLKNFTNALIVLKNDTLRLQQLKKISLSTDLINLKIKEILQMVAKDWGVSMENKECILNLDTIQLVSANHRVFLEDLVEPFLAGSSLNIIREYGVTRFDFGSLYKNIQVYPELVDVCRYIISSYTRCGTHKYWYEYRRNGLKPDDEAEKAYIPILNAKALVNSLNDGKALFPEYQSYEHRLATFSNFPIRNQIVHNLLAEAGFFSVNHVDYVQCYFCGQCIRILNVRRLWHTFYPEKCPLSQKKMEISDQLSRAISKSQLPELRVGNLISRIETFIPLIKSKKYDTSHLMELVMAGFYYLGTKEDMLCYSCCLGLTQIKNTTKPWNIHLRLSPNCSHLGEMPDEMRSRLIRENEIDKENETFVPYLEAELFLHKNV